MARRVKMSAARTRTWLPTIMATMLISSVTVLAESSTLAETNAADKDAVIAQSLAEMLRDARAVISDNEALINNPDLGDKNLTAKKVIDDAGKRYQKTTGVDPTTIDAASRQGRLLKATTSAIAAVM